MWEQYKKTFVGIQVGIWLVAFVVVMGTHDFIAGLVFLATMQTGAVLGAMWGTRLKTFKHSR